MITFDKLKPGVTCWLGCSPTDRRIQAMFDSRTLNGRGFLVINGAWRGVLHQGEGDRLFIIDERGERHDPVFIVDIESPRPSEVSRINEIPF